MPLFVYGTLLRGEPNHALIADAPFLGPARTPPRYELVDLGAFPALVPCGGTAVQGELYGLTPAELAAVDELEGHPVYYRRIQISTAEGRPVETYVLPAERARGLPRIPSGSWRDRSAPPAPRLAPRRAL